MDKALYVGMTGATQALRAQALNAHNLANASTVGYRGERAETAAWQVGGDGLSTRFQTALQHAGWDDKSGPIMQTGGDLDVAMKPGNWLAVQAPDGTEAYTRGGDLRVNALGQLTTSAGHPVMGDGGPLSVPPSSSVTIAADGTVSAIPLGQSAASPVAVGRLRVVQGGRAELDRGPEGLMRAREGIQLQPVSGDTLIPGALEGSNVNIADSMVNMIDLARRFELQTQMMKNADENAQQAATLMRMG